MTPGSLDRDFKPGREKREQGNFEARYDEINTKSKTAIRNAPVAVLDIGFVFEAGYNISTYSKYEEER